jgi:glucose-6-phosphate isomerase
MLADSPLTASLEYAALERHASHARQWQLRELFAQDPQRASRFTLEAAGLCLDYSKNHIDTQSISLLAAFARAQQMELLRDAMFRGEPINLSEQRSVLHTLLRVPRGTRFMLDGVDAAAGVHQVLDRMAVFCEAVRSGSWKGYDGQSITDVVNIGIGGSDLGPVMGCDALRPYAQPGLRMHFLSNVDGHALQALLPALDPRTTLVIVSSKSFTTRETMANAQAMRSWFLQHGKEADLQRHFVAVSTNVGEVTRFGINTANMFEFWDWVGGRYSVWSAIGLPLMLSIGPERFREFLSGAHAMDAHFRTAPLEANMPALLAMTGYLYRQFFHTASLLVAPYHQDLHLFPAWLRQLEMESNGKDVTRDGHPVQTPTCPVVWGSVGTNGQHAYFQLIHQGTDLIPVDFITALKPMHAHLDQHRMLLANCFAQAEALMNGTVGQALPLHRSFHGNRPSNMLLMEQLTPATLGALLALYEHKTFVQGILWNINSFDQWGVELGKTLAAQIQSELDDTSVSGLHDSSTAALVKRARAALK